jgi:hypothetical protein
MFPNLTCCEEACKVCNAMEAQRQMVDGNDSQEAADEM